MAAINFHPASPEYPGIGCNNFALYEGTTEYGVTCHSMAPQVDRGSIIAVKRFAVFPRDDVASLLTRTHDYLLVLFYEITSRILRGEPLPSCAETWSRAPFTRAQLDALSRIEPDMTREEIARRIRATAYGDFQPEVEIGGYGFRLAVSSIKP